MSQYKRKKFYSTEMLEEAVEQIADIAADDGILVALIGGFAMQLYGSDRMTGDIDVIADDAFESLPRGTPLAIGGEQTTAPNGVPVDIVERTDEEARALYDDALGHAIEIEGIAMRVVLPEYLAVLKIEAGRRKDELDLHFLIADEVIDLEKTARIIQKHLGRYAVREFWQTVEIANLERKRQ